MKTRLAEIANIETGIYVNPGLEGEVIYLQAKHFNEKGQLIDKVVPELLMSSKLEKHILNSGDILVAAKGTRVFATCIRSTDIQAVASSIFIIIRLNKVNSAILLPEYLTWYLNQPESLSLLKASSRGSSLPSIPKTALEEFIIPIPALTIQQTILSIQTLRDEQKALELKLGSLKDQLIHNQLIIKANNT